MAALWSRMRDAVDDLERKAEQEKKRWHETSVSFDLEIQEVARETQKSGASLASAEARSGEESDALAAKERESAQLEQLYKSTMAECKATMIGILYNEICGTISVRNQLLNATFGLKEEEIIDCSVTEWSPGECSVSCDDTQRGGLRTLSREVVSGRSEYGQPCPALSTRRSCGQIKCPVDCKLSEYEPFSKCTKECGGGVQSRSRFVLAKPKNGGRSCDELEETQTCNSGSCDRACTLSAWTPYSSCSQACGGGVALRRKSVVTPKRGEGQCWSADDPLRLQSSSCNEKKCAGDERCSAALDVVIAIDGSGSLTSKGFDILKEFAAKIVGRLDAQAVDGSDGVRVAVVQFGNGHLDKQGIVSDALLVRGLDEDPEPAKLQAAIRGLAWESGFTNMAQAIEKASNVLKRSDRRSAAGIAVVITDGEPTYRGATATAVAKLRETATLTMVHVKSFPKEDDVDLMRGFASEPVSAHYVHVPGKKKLREAYDAFATEVLVRLCPSAVSAALSSGVASDRDESSATSGDSVADGDELPEVG
eukprot:TRINITY_DN18918_c0_g1_i1.p1 TRINITY_DN18918_c0_g1~~TRINITY_DN18918_c0_g1_i1.p1  ORF type:complete len:626 (-),score=188.30 TRINITY_DN18918_c0_g1_i1:89-1699(-)